MRRVFLAAILATASTATAAAAQPSLRIQKLERWLGAVERHEPGTVDDASKMVVSWTIEDLRKLWIDLNSLVILMRNPKASFFTVKPQGKRMPDAIRYPTADLARLRLLARAADGTLADDVDASLELRSLSGRVRAANNRGDGNYVRKRGALLHADAAMTSGPEIIEATDRNARFVGPRRFAVLVQDGQSVDMGQGFVHWEIAGFLLDQVVPSPGADAMVRDFYRATIAYLQRERKYEDGYLEHALKLFPEDATLLFLSGCQHEAFASPPIQSVARSVSLPYGVTLGVESPGVERRRAENFFRRALDVDPGFIEARLRRGRVLGLLGRHTEAAGELQQVIHTTEDPLLQYYAELFMGAEREALGQFDAARDSYERAADLNAGAQAPHLALSQLARRTGNRTAALRALRQVFDVGSSAGGADDPWWTYSVTAGRNAGDVLEALWRPFRKELSEQR